MFLDSGSELTFITNRLVIQLKLQPHHSTIMLTDIGNTLAGSSKDISFITLKSLYSDAQVQVPLHILSSLITTLPGYNVDVSSWNHLQGLQLADPGNIDIVLGSIPFSQIINSEMKRAQSLDPIALRTIFGWIIFGSTKQSSVLTTNPVLHVQQDHALHELLSRFWLQEESPQSNSAQLRSDEEHCEAHFVNSHTRDSSSRYIVRLPIIPSPKQLGDSKNTGLRCLKSMLKRLCNDEKFNQIYRDFMMEYETIGHMRLAPETQFSSTSDSQLLEQVSAYYYLPHHGILKEQSVSTKLRVVFNGSARTSSGYSLKDILHTGSKLQLDIFDVLLWIRRHKIVFSSDLKKMFRQIDVHLTDWDLQRILRLDRHNNIVPYQLTTVTYETRPALFLAVRVLQQLVQDEGSKFPLAIAPMTKGRYVDDIFGGSDTLEEAQLIPQDLMNRCMVGRFPLAKWSSNSSAFLQALSMESVSTDPAQALDDTELKVLGLSWSPSFDQFIFSPQSLALKKITKRNALSEVSQLFDPIGFLAPIIIREKISIQELWLNKSGWDDELPDHIAQRWTHLRGRFPLPSLNSYS